MIPKIIHYCWFGGKEKPENVKKYIESWKKYCRDYEIIEWNESNFNVSENDYCKEAYEAKKWAFVTDYVRLKVLYEYGGIYMDTDVEVVRPLDSLLKYRAFSGYESKRCIPTGTMCACQGNEWIEVLLNDYASRHFLQEDGSLDLTTNVKVITKLTKQIYQIELDGNMKIFGNNMVLFPFEYLCAKDFETGIVHRTENTYTIHHFSGSWLSQELRYKQELKRKFRQIFSDRIASYMGEFFTLAKFHGLDVAIRKVIKWMKIR